MVPSLRKTFNAQFEESAYSQLLEEIDQTRPGQMDFRIAETPLFVPQPLLDQMIDTCEFIVEWMSQPSFTEITNRSIPKEWHFPGQEGRPLFLAFDFGICQNKAGVLEPQLIELQGFPTLFAWEVQLDDLLRKYFLIPAHYSCYLSGLNRESYLQLFQEILLGSHRKEEVVLLELFPWKQKTRIDFACTQEYIGIKTVCVTELIRESNQLFYFRDGKKTRIRRLYNRLIFDDLQQQSDEIKEKAHLLQEDLDVEWCIHPHWYYRISKFLLPFLKHPLIPRTYFLHEIKQLPEDLHNYVLKPLFSFAGQGVLLDLTIQDIPQITDPENWILQRKVTYAAAIPTPDEPAKAEVRIFYWWPEGAARPFPVNNLARLSKGKMIGTRYNKDRSWVGGSCCYFERP